MGRIKTDTGRDAPQIAIRVTKKEYQMLQDIAKRKATSVTGVVAELVHEWLR